MKNRSRKYNVLMLEDDADDRHITETTFSAHGYNIDLVFTTTGLQVMHHLSDCGSNKNYPFPDLVILDKNIPVRDGLDVLQEIKTHPVYKKIPVVMISGSAYRHDVEEAYSLGVNSFIQKPFSDKLTVEKIASFVKYWFETVELPILA